MSNNPYEAPTMPVETMQPAEVGDGMPWASQNKRFVNFFVDSIIVRICSFAAGFMLGMAYVASTGGNITESQEAQMQLIGMGLGILVVLSYYIILEGVFKITIGKLLTGTRVVNAQGGDASFGQIVGRSFARMIPFEAFSFLFGDKTTGWHDSLSGTRVIDTRLSRSSM